MVVTGIVLLEGADSSGKTTLAKFLVERHGARYLHSTVRREIWRWHVGALRRAIALSRTNLVVLDRLWLSELVYGKVFRGGPAYDVGARCLDRVLRRHGAVTVLCSPRDQEGQVERWRAGREAGKHEHFDRVREVVAAYADLRDGNLAVPGNGYLEQLTRFGDYTARDDVLVYDLDRYAGLAGRKRFESELRFRLAAVRALVRPDRGANLTGRWTPGLPSTLFVGEALSPTCRTWSARLPTWPWCDRDDHLGAATWLNRALHHLAVREDRIAFVNARPATDDHDYLQELLAEAPPDRVVALGRVAQERVCELAPHGLRTRGLPHPQWHRRFHHGEGPEGYAKLLEEALR